jgi:hypothetical protein
MKIAESAAVLGKRHAAAGESAAALNALILDHQVFFYVKQDLYSLWPFPGQLSDFTRI